MVYSRISQPQHYCTWGWIVLCCGGLSCALLNAEQHSWHLTHLMTGPPPSLVVANKNISRHFQMLPGGKIAPCYQVSKNQPSRYPGFSTTICSLDPTFRNWTLESGLFTTFKGRYVHGLCLLKLSSGKHIPHTYLIHFHLH